MSAPRRWFASWFRPNRQQRRAQGHKYRLHFENLEDRTVPAKLFQFTGADAADPGFANKLEEFRTGLGGVKIEDGILSNATGRRELAWDESAATNFSGNTFNTGIRRGVVFTVDGSTQASNFIVRDPDDLDTYHDDYPSLFASYSGNRVFSPVADTVTTVRFRDPANPGTDATVKGFGLVFNDVDRDDSTSIRLFYRTALGASTSELVVPALPLNGGFSFAGAIFTDGERIERVEITSGNTALTLGLPEVGATDLVVLDDIIYGQPQHTDTRFFRWNDVNGNWSDAANWHQTSGSDGEYPTNPNDVAVFGSNLTAARAINLNVVASLGAVHFDSTQNVTISATNRTLTFDTASGTTAALDVTPFIGTGTLAMDAPVVLRRHLDVTLMDQASQLQFADVVSDPNQNRSITQRGAGLLEFAGETSTFDGPLTTHGGTTWLNNATLDEAEVVLNGTNFRASGGVAGLTAESLDNTVSLGTPSTTGTLDSTRAITFDSNTTLLLKLRALDQYDRITTSVDPDLGNPSRDINLGGANLQLDLGAFDPAFGSTFVIAQVTSPAGGDTIDGQFAQGTFINAGGKLFTIQYSAKNVTLTRVDATATVNLTRSPAQDTVFGQAVTFTSTITTQAGAPAGSIVFEIHQGTTLVEAATVPFTGSGTTGSAQIVRSNLPQGTYTVSAVFVPTSPHNGNASNPATLNHTVNVANVSINVASNQSPAPYSTAVVTAHVQAALPGVGVPTSGTVQFYQIVNGSDVPLGTPVAINAAGNATLPVTLDAGSYQLRAAFTSTDGNFNSATTASSNTLSQQINPAATSTALNSNPANWQFNEDVVFTATVTSPEAPGQVPTGSVEFFRSGQSIGIIALANGQAMITTQFQPGPQSMRAVYLPTTPPGNFATSEVIINRTVTAAPVTVTVAAQPTTIVFGEEYALSATVASSNPNNPTPTGNVVFTLTKPGTTVTSNPVALLNGQVTLNGSELASLPTGTYNVTASYQGSAQYQAQATTVTGGLVVNPANVSVALSPASAITGALVQMPATVTVDAPGTGVPAGNVLFVVALNGQTVMTQVVPLQHNNGINTATFSTNSLLPGSYTVTANYQATGTAFNNSLGTPVGLVIDQADTTLLLDPNPASQYGDPAIFQAHVSSVIPNSGVAVGGDVRFQLFRVIGGVPTTLLADVNRPVINGTATFTASTPLPVGLYQVVSHYLGDVAFRPSGPAATLHAIGSAFATVSVQAVLQNPQGTPVFGQPLTFRATVAAANPNAGIPDGTVTFTLVLPDGSANIVSPPVFLNANGTADFSPAQVLPPTEGRGPIQVFVAYNGDDSQQRFLPASNTTNPLLQTILRPSTATSLTVTRIDNAAEAVRYGGGVRLTATVVTTGLDAVASQRAGMPRGKVQFVYLKNGQEVNLGAPVALNTQGVATLESFNGQPLRLPVGLQTFLARYVDDRPYAIFNPSSTQQSVTVQPQEVIAELLTVKPKTGSISRTNTYAFGRSLVFTIRYRFATPVSPGTLLDGSAAQTVPTGTGQFRFTNTTGVVFTTPVLNLSPVVTQLALKASAVKGKAAALTNVQPYATLTFTSSPLFNTSIVNRTAGTNKSLIIQPGRYNVTMSYVSNTPNAESFNFNKITLNLAFTVQTASVGRRW
jgi:hypothetical protein